MRHVGSFAASFAWLAHRSVSRWSHGFLEAFEGTVFEGYQRILSLWRAEDSLCAAGGVRVRNGLFADQKNGRNCSTRYSRRPRLALTEAPTAAPTCYASWQRIV